MAILYINSVKGTAKFTDLEQDLNLKWTRNGFKLKFGEISLHIPVTEVGSEILIDIILEHVSNITNSSPTIINHEGVEIESVEFLPPNFNGDSNMIEELIVKRSILQLAVANSMSHTLEPYMLEELRESGL
jgi:hypothetical protein